MAAPRGSGDRPDIWELRLRLGRDSDLSSRQLHRLLGLDRWVILRRVLRGVTVIFAVLGCIGLTSLERSTGSADQKARHHAESVTWSTVTITISLVCLLGWLLVSRRIRRVTAGRYASDLRDPTGSPVQVMRLPAPSSAARQPVSSLRAAHALLSTVIPELERARPGISEMAENTRLTLESRARRIVLIERTLAEADGPSGGDHADRGYGPLRRTRVELADRLRAGVQRYEELVAQAVSAGDSRQSLEMDTIGATAATEELAAWEAGMREVQQIALIDD